MLINIVKVLFATAVISLVFILYAIYGVKVPFGGAILFVLLYYFFRQHQGQTESDENTKEHFNISLYNTRQEAIDAADKTYSEARAIANDNFLRTITPLKQLHEKSLASPSKMRETMLSQTTEAQNAPIDHARKRVRDEEWETANDVIDAANKSYWTPFAEAEKSRDIAIASAARVHKETISAINKTWEHKKTKGKR